MTALIDGSAPGALKLPEILATDLHVDWRQVRRWGINEAKIPKDAILHFREPSLWDAYRKEVIAAGAAILLLAGLSTLLFAGRRSLVRTSAALKTSEQRMTHAARAARLATWIWNSVDDRISVSPLQPLFQSAGMRRSTSRMSSRPCTPEIGTRSSERCRKLAPQIANLTPNSYDPTEWRGALARRAGAAGFATTSNGSASCST